MTWMSRHDYFTISSPGAPPQPVICGTMQVILMMVVTGDSGDDVDGCDGGDGSVVKIQSGTHLYVEMEGREGLGCAQLSITQVGNFLFLWHFVYFLAPK